MRKTYMEELERKFDEASESDSVSVDTNTSERQEDNNDGFPSNVIKDDTMSSRQSIDQNVQINVEASQP